ncbi:transport protein [Companilactobacillus tucceti DSM 20183]|uniref:Transport protein n=2 Tax=Companilactobacillus tucceti TaxID=238012 RepID=A0A0R1IXQ8_9LACO|nr:transport protein [Companilactobacillus tucceti DSM 20183]
MGDDIMIGTIFNVSMILIGSIIGRFLHKGMKPEFQKILTQGLGLAAMVIGINAVVQHMPKSHYPVLFIVSLAIGGLLGQWIDLQSRFDKLVGKFSGGNLAEGLATVILLYCIGSLSILGPIEAALKHDYTFLFTNGMLDGITSIVLASTFGLGIAFAAVAVLLWQGSIYMIALFFQGALNTNMINELTIVGGILILASGLGLLEIKKISVLNLLPSLAVPLILIFLLSLF